MVAGYVVFSSIYTEIELNCLANTGTGKSISFTQVTVEEFKQRLGSAGLPPHIVLDLSDALLAWDEFGCQYSPESPVTIH